MKFNLNQYQIQSISDQNKKTLYRNSRNTFIYGISLPLREALFKKGIYFAYSKRENEMTVQQMTYELKQICLVNKIDDAQIKKIVLKRK